jgi:methylmalonyl-CoA mutase
VRGGDALRDVKSGWQVAEAFPPRVLAADAQRRVLVALTEGVSALVLRVGGRGSRRDWTAARRCVPRPGPVVLDAGADYVAATDACWRC